MTEMPFGSHGPEIGSGNASKQPESQPPCQVVSSLHPMHCGGACMLNLHLENGRVARVTSAGDIPRAGSHERDESLVPMQRRACLMGLSDKKRVFAPDRLKYPLKQTMERGNVRGFRRIGWDEALDTVAGWYREMLPRMGQLGYLPILDEGGVAAHLGPHLRRFGNPSTGNLQAATFAAIGSFQRLKGHPPLDAFNSKYIVIWGNDTQATLPTYAFIVMKAKEAGIPVTVVDTRYTDSAAAMGSASGSKPRYISVRPGTDAALIAAMANVIYRRRLHDEAYIRSHCFGFYPGETVTSQSPASHPVTGEPYRGRTFQVPAGQSFVEYLDELEREHGGYAGVLDWAARLTSVDPAVIESFAIEYATAKPAFIFSKATGPQRTHNGMYFSWMIIALSAMTGNATRRGGGFGDLREDDGYSVELPPAPSFDADAPFSPVLFSSFGLNSVLLQGRDGRTPEQLRDDVRTMNGIDLGPDARLTLEMYVRGAVTGNIFNQIPNINRRVLAWKRLKHVVSYERFMSTTAAWSDIILPTVTSFEESGFQQQRVSDLFVVNGPMSPMYEARPDWWINEQLAARLGIPFRPRTESDREIMERQWQAAKLPEAYQAINPDAVLPDFEAVLAAGSFQLPVPPEQTVIQTAEINPGEFDTDTGRINFYSPYFAERSRAVLKSARAQYVRPAEGYEDILAGGKAGVNGQVYDLQFITPHVGHRALTTFSNVPVLGEQRPHAVEMHPDDAAVRGIKDGDPVYVYNDLGCIRIPAALTVRIPPGVVSIGQGMAYRPSLDETYEAAFAGAGDGDGVPERHAVPVDVGGCTNSITRDLNSGILDPFFCGLGLNAGGALCAISRTRPPGAKPCMPET